MSRQDDSYRELHWSNVTDPASDTSRWTALPTLDRPAGAQSVPDTLRHVLADTDLSIRAHTWLPRIDPLTAPCWWQWRTPCDCPDTSFGRNPHRWNCPLTPDWAYTMRRHDINPWTVVTNAVQPIPQLEVWRREREAREALIGYDIAASVAACLGMLAYMLGLGDLPDIAGAEAAALARSNQAALAVHPYSLAAEFGAHTETDYYRQETTHHG